MKETKTILVMDDEPDYVDMVKQFLEEEGYHVLTAGDGDSGLKIVKNLRPDLVIMDVNMPHKDGLQFYREISTAHGRAKLPVLVITARGELEPLFRELEVEGFLTKPFKISKLLEEIKIIFNKTKEKTVFLMDLKELPSTLGIAETLRRDRYRVVFVEDLVAFKQEVVSGDRPDFVVMEYARAEKESSNPIAEIKKILSAKTVEKVSPHPVPVVVYTYSGINYEEKSLADGADQYIGRPGNYDAVVVAIREFEIEEKEKKH